MAELNGIVIKVKLYSEAQSVIITSRTSLDVVLLLTNIFSSSLPAPLLVIVLQQLILIVLGLPLVNVEVQSLFGVDAQLVASQDLLQPATLFGIHKWS